MRLPELKDISKIKTDMSKPLVIRRKDFITQINNPYMFTCNGLTVQVEFSGDVKMDNRIIHNLIKKLARNFIDCINLC